MTNQRAILAAIALSVAICVPAGTPAQVLHVPPPQSPAVQASENAHALKGPAQHTFYGTIVVVHPTIVEVRARSGQVRRVDPSEAIQTGRYSAPLFVGKIVAVEGYVSGGVFHAQRITRMTKLEGTAPDH